VSGTWYQSVGHLHAQPHAFVKLDLLLRLVPSSNKGLLGVQQTKGRVFFVVATKALHDMVVVGAIVSFIFMEALIVENVFQGLPVRMPWLVVRKLGEEMHGLSFVIP